MGDKTITLQRPRHARRKDKARNERRGLDRVLVRHEQIAEARPMLIGASTANTLVSKQYERQLMEAVRAFRSSPGPGKLTKKRIQEAHDTVEPTNDELAIRLAKSWGIL